MLLDDVAGYLQAVGLGTISTNIFMGDMPFEPAVALAIFEYPGLAPEYTYDEPLPNLEYPRIQVWSRAGHMDYQTARANAEAAYRALAAIANRVLGATWYPAIRPLQSPFFLKRDDQNQPIVAFNCQVTKGMSP